MNRAPLRDALFTNPCLQLLAKPHPNPASTLQSNAHRLHKAKALTSLLSPQRRAGLNCLILDFATVLTHDLFNSHNGYNENSSYADLSPLYGHDSDKARRVRKFKRGLLDLEKVSSAWCMIL